MIPSSSSRDNQQRYYPSEKRPPYLSHAAEHVGATTASRRDAATTTTSISADYPHHSYSGGAAAAAAATPAHSNNTAAGHSRGSSASPFPHHQHVPQRSQQQQLQQQQQQQEADMAAGSPFHGGPMVPRISSLSHLLPRTLQASPEKFVRTTSLQQQLVNGGGGAGTLAQNNHLPHNRLAGSAASNTPSLRTIGGEGGPYSAAASGSGGGGQQRSASATWRQGGLEYNHYAADQHNHKLPDGTTRRASGGGTPNRFALSSSSGHGADGIGAAAAAAAATPHTSYNNTRALPVAVTSSNSIKPDWRLKERMKTVGVGLVLALNIGTDPPDVVKPHPCAVKQTWLDPRSVSRAKAKEMIGERLEQQYAKWQLARSARPLKYRRCLDPTVEDVRSLCMQMRRQARNERILLHYNGHGVPRPTDHGEVWVFDKNHTEYIPLSVSDLRQWLGKPSIVVLDCSAAGILMPFLTVALNDDNNSQPPTPSTSQSNFLPQQDGFAPQPNGVGLYAAETMGGLPLQDMDELASQWVRDTIVLAPCAANELLPMDPDYPADIFTSCLTTPIPISLRWFIRQNPSGLGASLDPEIVDYIPGKASDRKTPLGELNWIFTAVTDSIAWNILPKPLFQRLFRQDLLVASLFRNFLLADRILRRLGCTPVSYPPLPPGIADHPLWQAWDLACETLLFQLMKDGVLTNQVSTAASKAASVAGAGVPSNLGAAGEEDEEEGGGGGGSATLSSDGDPSSSPQYQSNNAATSGALASSSSSSSISSPFFTEQLTAFEVWLDFAAIHRVHLESGTLDAPEQLPVVLQVLLSQAHRIRALMLLRRFLDLGPWAVNLSLSLGIFPYVMKLLQSQDYKSLLVSIWASILSFDPSCRVDLLKDGAIHHFVTHLTWGLDTTNVVDVAQAARERTLAAFVLSIASYEYPAGQAECVRLNLHGNCCALLSSYEQGENVHDDHATVELHLPSHLRLWLVLCLANMVKDNAPTQNEAYSAGVLARLKPRLNDQSTDVRAAVAYTLGCLIGSHKKSENRSTSMEDLQQSPSRPTPTTLVGGASQQRLVVADGITIGVATSQLPPNFAGIASLAPLGTVQGLEAVGNGPLLPPLAAAGHITGQDPPEIPLVPPVTHQQQGHWTPQAVSLRSPLHPGGAAGAVPYLMHQVQPIAPAGFILGSPMAPPLPSAGQTFTQTAVPMNTRALSSLSTRPSVYEDKQRLALDLAAMDLLMQSSTDACVTVRLEAVTGIGCAVGKYLEAFLMVAQELTTTDPDRGDKLPALDLVDVKSLDSFRDVWRRVRSLQRKDPLPAIAKAANNIVSVVHESLLRWRTELYHHKVSDPADERVAMDSDNPIRSKLGDGLNGIDEEGHPVVAPGSQTGSTPRSGPGRILFGTTSGQGGNLRRVVSEVATGKASSLMEVKATSVATETGAEGLEGRDGVTTSAVNYSLPISELYEWKKRVFAQALTAERDGFGPPETTDLLSPDQAARAYQEQRNVAARERGLRLGERYAILAPKPPRSEKSIQFFLDEKEEEAALLVEEEVVARKGELELKETKLLQNEHFKMTSMIVFHPFEDYLMACGGYNALCLWDIANNRRVCEFTNGNPKESRLTWSCWMNEGSTSLFLVGCDDGTARIWGDLLGSYGEPSTSSPSLVSAFHALPMTPGQRGSGLVCEWQPYTGTLLAGGNSSSIALWDVEYERQYSAIETNTDACVTTLTTAWDYDHLGVGDAPQGYNGIGRDVIVAGHSDGSLKIFDIRSNHRGGQTSNGTLTDQRRMSRPSSSSSRRHGIRATQYSEHKSWVVGTKFTTYSSRYEIVSGTISGEVKAWDLRMSSSVRTFEAQRSTMTALAVHPRIPVMATGSHAQFIKLLTLDGDTMQVLRYHDKSSQMASHRIGPVSCLTFHPNKPLLAAGATDSFIGLYSTKQQIGTGHGTLARESTR